MTFPISYILRALINKAIYISNKIKRESVKILNAKETVNHITDKKLSISRYGDGELNMVLKYIGIASVDESGFQNFNVDLGRRLYEILKEGNDENCNFKIALPGCMFGIGTGYLRRQAAVFWEDYSNKYLTTILQIIDSGKEYLETNFSRFYLSHKDKSGCREYIETVKRIWKGRDVVIVEGDRTCLGVGNDLFAEAKSVERVLCPSINAWDKYEDIIKYLTLTPYARNQLILCALGMTATVLAHDLAKAGYQAIDIGHIDIEYEWMLMGATSKVAVPGKFTNESKAGKQTNKCLDPMYQSQIIKRI